MTVDIATLAIRVDSTEARNASRDLTGLRDSGAGAERATDGLTGAARTMAAVLKTVAAAAAAIKLYDVIKEATLLASRYNELGIVMNVVGRNAGFSAAQMASTEAALRKTGISALQSREAISKLISANIDLSQATDLARLAQDAAVIAGMNSSEAFARLVKGIQSAEKETLETMGLNVNFQKSYEALGRTLGKNADDLTTVEKTQAAVNAVMAKAPAISGAYEASLTNAGKQMRSMDRYLEDLKVQLGQPFQNPFEGLIAGSTKALKFALDNVGAIRAGIDGLIAAIVPAMKVAAAYFAIFIAGPAIYTAVTVAATRLVGVLATYTMNVMIGQTATLGFNTVLFGTSVAANLASGSLSKLALAGNILFSAFAGWQIGSYLNDNFVEARVAGLAFVGSILKGWEHVKYGAEMAWEGIKFAWNRVVGAMKTSFADYLTTISNGLAAVGAADTSKQVAQFADSMRVAAGAQKTFAEQTAGITAAHAAAVDVIDQSIVELVQFELQTTKVTVAEKAVAPAVKAVTELTEAQRAAMKRLAEAQKAFIDGLQKEVAELGLSETAIQLREAAILKLNKKEMELVRTLLAKRDAFKRSEDMAKIQADYAVALGKTADEANKEADANEELVRTFGMAKSAIEYLTIARLEEKLLRIEAIDGAHDEAAALEIVIAARKRSAAAMSALDALESGKKLADENLASQKAMWESIDKTAHDTFISIFDSGKNAFDRLKDTLKNGLLDLLYQMTIKKWIFQIGAAVTGGGVAGAAQAAGSNVAGSVAGGAAGAVAGGLFGAGGMAGALAGGAGWLTGATTLGGSLSAGASLLGTGTLAGGLSGAGMIVGALAPIALGIAAAVAIWKKIDTSGTYHTGGAASASKGGVSTIAAESLGFAATRTNKETESMVSGLAQGIVSILDSTATAFGKQAGYTAATAFADDSSKDGAWGGLLIKKMGETVLDWNSNRTSRWAPQEFGDGKAGQEQYLAALSASVRTALDGIGMPAWAKKMLDGLGGSASLEEMAKVVDAINMTQTALVQMGDKLVGFASMSESAVSALIAASGGIEALAGNASAYYDNFYTEAEKLAESQKQLTEAITAAGIAMPATRDEFRAQVEAQMALGEAGAPVVAALLKVSAAFAELHPVAEMVAEAVHVMADAQVAFMDGMNRQSASAGAGGGGAPTDDSMTRWFYAMVASQQAEAAAKLKATWLDLTDSIFDEVKRIRGLLVDNGSAGFAQVQAQFATATAQARAGDQAAAALLPKLSQAMLQLGEVNSATVVDLQLLRANTAASLYDTGRIGAGQFGLSIPGFAGGGDFMGGLRIVGENGPELEATGPSRIFSAGQTARLMGGDNSDLIAEVRALRAEVAAFHSDNSRENVQTIKHVQNTSDILDAAVNGGVPIPVEVAA